jgi:hypothetical protein
MVENVSIELVSDGPLVAIGLLIFTDCFTTIARVLQRYLPTF